MASVQEPKRRGGSRMGARTRTLRSGRWTPSVRDSRAAARERQSKRRLLSWSAPASAEGGGALPCCVASSC